LTPFNFTVQDILGSFLAFLILSLVMIVPGYVFGWTLNLFEFKARRFPIRLLISTVISISVCPVLLYNLFRLGSVTLVWWFLFLLLVVFLGLLLRDRKKILSEIPFEDNKVIKRYVLFSILIGGIWVIFCIIFLVDLQWGNRLYFNSVAYDYATRVAMVGAITRTGVPPVNPSYFPGHPEQLTFLYYFWYILGSIADQLGSQLVDARMALIASVAWCGLGLMATIALYLRLRKPTGGVKLWRSAFVGVGLLLISGLDFIPVAAYLTSAKIFFGFLPFDGRIEAWNEQVTAWTGSIIWVPIHVASTIACLIGMMLFYQSVQVRKRYHQIGVIVISGMAFSSALGLSTWVTFVFVIFWCVWMVAVFLDKKRRSLTVLMLMVGVVALLVSVFYIGDVMQGGSSLKSPIAFAVRPFGPVTHFLSSLPIWVQNIFNLMLLPINYIFELGFFFWVGVIWIVYRRRSIWQSNPFFQSEFILLATVVILASFVRSTVIHNNDLGWRSWLLGQFVLLIWAVDLSELILNKQKYEFFAKFQFHANPHRLKFLMGSFLIIGLLTTGLDLTILRFWTVMVDMDVVGFPNELSPDTHLGERTYAARLAYNYINDSLPDDVIVQYNPKIIIDRPSGLYANRQMVISDHTMYGVPIDIYDTLVSEVSQIFLADNSNGWKNIDTICQHRLIDVVVFNDTDSGWKNLDQLENLRKPLYRNNFYAVFACGNYVTISAGLP